MANIFLPLVNNVTSCFSHHYFLCECQPALPSQETRICHPLIIYLLFSQTNWLNWFELSRAEGMLAVHLISYSLNTNNTNTTPGFVTAFYSLSFYLHCSRTVFNKDKENINEGKSKHFIVFLVISFLFFILFCPPSASSNSQITPHTLCCFNNSQSAHIKPLKRPLLWIWNVRNFF